MSHVGLKESPTAAPVEQRVNRLAVWSLVLSVIMLGGLGSIAGIVLGVKARRRIQQTGERGSGLAMAGIVVGVITLVLAVAYWAWVANQTGHGGGVGPGGGGGGDVGGSTGGTTGY